MSDVRFLSYPKFHATDDNGKPLVGGKLNVYAAGTTDRIDTWTDFDQTSKNTNPVILNSRGEADVFFDAPAKLVLTDKNDVTIWTLDDISPLNAQTLTGQYNLVQNGSFELDGDGDGNPDSWDIVETTSTSTIEVDTGSVAHGTQALKFASAGGGGGTATTSSKFPVSDGDTVGVSFFVTSTSVTATNKVDLITYDKSGGNPATQNVYTSSGTAPTSFEQKAFSATIPSGKTQAELKLTGVDNAVTATTYFDFVQVLDQGYVFTGTPGEVSASASELNKTSFFSNVNADVTATDEELNNADADTAGGGFLIGSTASSDPGLAFNTWRTPNANRAVLVTVKAAAVTDGTTSARIDIRVDESGGTSFDYFLPFADAPPNTGSTVRTGVFTFMIPAGGSYRVENTSDPDNANAINDIREFVL